MWQSLLVYNACPQPQTEATVLVSPSLLQIDTFGKWCRCLHNVCYLKLKKRRYLDKCRLSAPADSTVPDTCLVLVGKKHQRNLNTSFIQTQYEDKQMGQPHENRVKQSDVVGRSHPFADSHPI